MARQHKKKSSDPLEQVIFDIGEDKANGTEPAFPFWVYLLAIAIGLGFIVWGLVSR
jgi:hypothetical protein